jgi:hypothetical protein
MSRRRYRTVEACDACGRMISEEQLASHERSCPAWRRRTRGETPEAPETTPQACPEAPRGAGGATGGSGP